MIKPILVATVLAFGVGSAAHAVPVKPSASPNVAVSSDLIEVGKKSYKGKAYKGGKYKGKAYKGGKYKGKVYKGGKYKGSKYYRGKYKSGRKYARAPKGWRGYHYRPYGWYGRGCIVIGPLWYCPW